MSDATHGEALALRERKRLFDDLWLVTLVVAFAAIATPWFLHILEVDLGPIAWALFGFGVLHLASMFAADALGSGRSLLALGCGLQACGLLVLGLVWHLGGGLSNPMLLLLFALPVIAGGLLVRWHALASALLAIATVVAISVRELPELRWYLAQSGLPLPAWGNEGWSNAAPLFPGLSAPASYSFVALQLFAVLLFAVALATESFRSLLMRLYARVRLSHDRLGQAERFAAGMLAAAPLPTALIDADTFRVALASPTFLGHFRLEQQALAERDLFGLIAFTYPEVVQELIAAGGTAQQVTYRAGDETCIARVCVQRIEHAGTRYAHLSLEDTSQTHCLQGMLDALHEAWVAIGPGGRLLHSNRAAQALLGAPSAGMDAVQALALPGLADDWWALGPRSEHERSISIAGRPHLARSVALRVPGERHSLTLVALRPLAGEA